MVNPDVVKNYERTEYELQEFALFCILVAGKTAMVVSRQLEKILQGARELDLLPFDYLAGIIRLGYFDQWLKERGIGCAKMKAQAIDELIRYCQSGLIHLRTCAPQQLEFVHGIGPKTSRFFVVNVQDTGNRYAILDTHTLAWLRDNGYPQAPKTTPGSRTSYTMWEQIFIDTMTKVDPEANLADFDIAVWKERSRRVKVS